MTIVLERKRLQEPQEAHIYLKNMFGFPDYYGYNLDALYDCLTDITEDTEIMISPAANAQTDSEYFFRLRDVIRDAVCESPVLVLNELSDNNL